MGNCQAVDAATLVLQHPSGKVDKYYWPVSASEVMKMNPGHYVALLLSTTLYPPAPTTNSGDCAATTTTTTTNNNGPVRLTKIKLLRPTDTLVLGHVYRLITTQEVMRGMWAKKQAKMKNKNPSELSAEKPERVKNKHGSGFDTESRSSAQEKNYQVSRNERNRARTAPPTNAATARSRTWQPSLQSISEAVNSST